MATSVGTNPYYHGEKRTVVGIYKTLLIILQIEYLFKETHIMHEFPEDFYGATLKIVLLGEIRKMTTFNSLGTLNKEFSID